MKEIIIKKIENKNNFFIAYFKNHILNASYSVCFSDSITGAIALNDFYKMLKTKYDKDSFDFVISDEGIKIKNDFLIKQINKEAVR